MSIDKIKAIKLGLYQNNVSIDFTNSNVVTIIGKNGSGKSLFLKDLENRLHSLSNKDKNDHVELEKSLTKQDINYLKEKIFESDFINDKTKEDLNDFFKDRDIFSNEQLIFELNHFYKGKIFRLLVGWEEIVSTDFLNLLKSILSIESNGLPDVVSEIKKLNHFSNDYDLIWTQIQKISDSFQSIINFITERIGQINPVYVNCIDQYNLNDEFFIETIWIDKKIESNKNVRKIIPECDDILYSQWDDSLEKSYESHQNNNGGYKPKVISLIDNNNRLLYNILQNSCIKSNKFRSMNIDQIVELNNDKKFQDSINNWLKPFLSQPLEFNLFFEKISNYNRCQDIKAVLSIYDYAQKQYFKINELSSGTKVLFKIFSSFSKINNQSIIIIDEPETGMHPTMQFQLKESLYDLAESTGSRIIISTHSMFFIPKDIKLIYISYRNRNKKNIIQQLIPAEQFYNEHGIANDLQLLEMLYYVPFHEAIEYTKTGVNVLVEGKTDVIYLSHFRDLFGIDQKVIRFISPPLSSNQGYEGILHSLNSLKKHNKKLKFIISCDSDVLEDEHFNNKLKETKETIIPLGYDKSCIESWFENEDRDKYTLLNLNSRNNKKINCAMKFKENALELEDLDKKTISNFKELFKKYKVL